MPYTSISTFQRLPRGTWEANTSSGIVEVSQRDAVWKGRWLDGPWIEIPGSRNLLVYECTANATVERRKLGRRYQTVSRVCAEKLPPLIDWCIATAEPSIHDDGAFWLEWGVWRARSQDPLPMPFIPELDEPSEELQCLARTERICREARARLDQAHVERGEALIDATRKRRSRRRLAGATGLSFARVQQLLRQGEARRAAAREQLSWVPSAVAVRMQKW
ncbi:MAG: hypothetical protein E6G34_06475 [Actinobacteria bacterium]|nr:MAG: hypothetical protein E6G34_06475 [Actinomycetota bacterium]